MDSREWWSRAYNGSMAAAPDGAPSSFALELAASLPERRRILDLGCGPGYDSTAFAQAGHQVVAADFIRLDATWQTSRMLGSSLSFVLLDLRSALPFADASFDVVYARLSLHYFSTEITGRIFGEIHRVLSSDGLFTFICKSTNDPRYGYGEPVGPNMFRINHKVYHFFDEAFARHCLGSRFHIKELWSGPMETYGEASDVVRASARKAKTTPNSAARNS